MIQSLDDAWKWYTAVRKIAYDMRHLAGIWDEPALETVLSLDGRLRHRTAADLKDAVNTILGTDDEDLNDEPENSVDPKAAKGRLDLYLQRLAELEAAGEMSEAK